MKIIYKAIVGSHSYGTSIPESDIDIKGVFLQSPESVLNDGYIDQINVTDDEVYYELRRFIELCCKNNPTVLELLFSPEDCIIEKHPSFDLLIENRDKFITKGLKNSFGGYAYSQIKKANGFQKMVNWEKKDMVRKNPIDFCWVVLDTNNSVEKHDREVQRELYNKFAEDVGIGLALFANSPEYDEIFGKIKQGVFPLKKWLTRKGLTQNDIVITKLNHTKEGHQIFALKNEKGIGVDKSNKLRTSPTPKDARPIATLLFNSDDYSAHCKKYKQYQDWLKNRNTQRYVDIKNHNQKIDGKNMLHCTRLIEMGLEIAQGLGFNVRRPNAEYLISIRRGEVSLEDILKNAESNLKKMELAFDESDLPSKVDYEFFKQIMVKIRKYET